MNESLNSQDITAQAKAELLRDKEEQARQAAEAEEESLRETRGSIIESLYDDSRRRTVLDKKYEENKGIISLVKKNIQDNGESISKFEDSIKEIEVDEDFNKDEAARSRVLEELKGKLEQLKLIKLAAEGYLKEKEEENVWIYRELRGLMRRAQSVIGERKIGEGGWTHETQDGIGNINTIWNYVEGERRAQESLPRYKLAGFEKAKSFAVWASNEEAYQRGSVIKTEGSVTYNYKLGGQYMDGPPPVTLFTDPRFYNAYIKGFKEGLSDDSSLTADGTPKTGRLTDEQIERVRATKYTITLTDPKGEQNFEPLVIYGGTELVLPKEVPEDPFLASLTEGERRVARESILNPGQDKDTFIKALRLSEYRPDVDEAIRKEAEGGLQEYVKQKLAEKTPELEEAIQRTLAKVLAEEEEIKKLEEARVVIVRINEVVSRLAANKTVLAGLQNDIARYDTLITDLTARRNALPRGFFGLSRQPKDKIQDEQIAVDISNMQNQKALAEQRSTEISELINEAEAKINEAILELKRRNPSIGSDLEGILTMESDSASSYARRDRFSEMKTRLEQQIVDKRQMTLPFYRKKLEKLNGVKQTWEAGDDLYKNLSEMLGK